MRGLALTPNHHPSPSTRRAVPPGAGQHPLQSNHYHENLGNRHLAVIAWIILAIVLFALSPILIKLIEVANHLNHFFGS